MSLVQDTSPYEQPMGTADAGSGIRANGRGFGRYLLTMNVFLLVMYCLPLVVVRRADFDAMVNTPYSLPLNYAFQLKGVDADVVLFGDSTALHGIDPSQMSRELGMKVVNLPNTAATLRVMDDLSLRRYLDGNRPPRLIVFYFAAWDMDYSRTPLPIGTYEGREVLAHAGTPAEIGVYVRHHPVESLLFPFQFYLANSSWRAVVKRPFRYAGEEVVRTHGHLSNPRLMPLSDPCEFWPAMARDLQFNTVKALGAKYVTAETKVLYFVAPIPACRNADAVAGQAYGALPAAAPRILPLSMFSGSVMYLHPRPEAVPAVTEQLEDAVRPLLASSKQR